MSLKTYMQREETQRLWSMRWVIVGQFCMAGFLLAIALEARGLRIPVWVFWAFAVGMFIVALLASIAKAVQPPGGIMHLPLGDAVAPILPSLNPMAKQQQQQDVSTEGNR